jgi:pSer/pThr/pTyr-binding forkhead associated (FHA) protein
MVGADGVLLDDCGSKNGTFLAGTRVTSAVKIANRDAIHAGSLLLMFRMCDGLMSTETNIQPARNGTR